MKKNRERKKLSLQKFNISKLTNLHYIFGGGDDDSATRGTKPTSPTQTPSPNPPVPKPNSPLTKSPKPKPDKTKK